MATGETSETVQFTVPAGVPYGTYSLTTIANGISSITSQSILVGPAITVTGSGQPIVHGAVATSPSNATAFGSSPSAPPLSQSFTIANSGTAVLTVGSVSIGGTNAGDFSVTTQPAISVPVGGSSTFTIQFVPTAPGSRVATVSFSENDASQTSPFTFAISGQGIGTPTVTVSDAGGPYTGNPYPAAALVNGLSSLETVADAGLLCGHFRDWAVQFDRSQLGRYIHGRGHVHGQHDYAPASSNPLTFSIGQLTPNVTVSDAGGPYTGNPYPAAAWVDGSERARG